MFAAVSATPRPLHVAFLGCGFITGVHSRHLRALAGGGDAVLASYASRDAGRAEATRERHGGVRAFTGYEAALADPDVEAVVVAVPPAHHLDLVLAALEAGKHVLVEKPAFLTAADYERVIAARDAAGPGRVVLVGENDHYKPLAVTLRALLAQGAVGELVMASFVTVADKAKAAEDWRNDEALAGGDAFFEEGIHWLHLADSLGPRITRITGHRPALAADVEQLADRRSRSRLVSFEYDSGAVGALFYSREVPSLLQGLRVSKLWGREGVITFESNGAAVVVRSRHRLRGAPRVVLPGYRDIRGYQAMYRDLVRSVRAGTQPEMSLERALSDHRLMEEAGVA
ncbi:Gfo/Idh/MocA family oxidoreductase [Nocardioides nanhaiensis]|uniref:Gfo/Idh/MocA family oxidoreductase n=1 Tax=Nocardioides nanhaiensis TaxID=1476871 RepID=A0ABP8WRP0_9ACTN